MVVNKSKEMAHFEVNVLGKQNIQNLLAAILAAKEIGMKKCVIHSSVKQNK